MAFSGKAIRCKWVTVLPVLLRLNAAYGVTSCGFIKKSASFSGDHRQHRIPEQNWVSGLFATGRRFIRLSRCSVLSNFDVLFDRINDGGDAGIG